MDFLATLALVAATLYYAWRYVDFSIPPFEDAAMLMRYAQHLAGGHGIVWNIGEAPVDGATDFLFMAASAALIKSGLTVGRAVRGIGFASHLLTVLLIYWANRKIHHTNIALSLTSGMYLAVGTGLSYVAAYFGTPFFALAATVTWIFGLLLMRMPTSSICLSLGFALSGLISGLIRPEGVILAGLMIFAVVVRRGFRASLPILLVFFLVFISIGGIYFLWRWDYFGYPLPNPYYKKGDMGLHWDSFNNSLRNTLQLCLPVMVAFLLGFRTRETTRVSIAHLIPIIGFASVFVLISDEMNFGSRFQYALMPIALISWNPLVRGIRLPWYESLDWRERIVSFTTLACLTAGVVYYSWYQNCFLTSFQRTCASPYERDGRFEMGKLLAQYREEGYVIATTEAGLVPYYSGWTAIDTWGLNDQFIAHNGGITEEYLDRYQPHIIMFHDYYSPLVPPKLTEANLSQRWFSMTILLKTYAESNGYVLAAVFGDSPYDTNYFYVRTDFEDSQALIKQISSMRNYYWFATGKRSINYAGIQQP